MYLQSALKPYFSAAIRDRGYWIYRNQQVKNVTGDPWFVEADVQGTDLYEVEIERNGREMVGSCSCPYYESQGKCKHLWALLLAAESRDYLGGDDSALTHRLRWSDEMADDEEIPVTPRPTWREVVEQARLNSRRQEAVVEWKDGREIYYLLDRHGSVLCEELRINVAVREPLKTGGFGKLKAMALLVEGVTQFAGPADREILLTVGGAAAATDYYGEGERIPEAFTLRSEFAREMLPRICATGRCRFRKTFGSDWEETESLTWDSGEPWRFSLRVLRGDKGFLLEGAFTRGAERIELVQAQLVVRAGFLVAEGRVSRLVKSASLGWIDPLIHQQPAYIPENEAGLFIQEVMRGGAAPDIEWPEDLRFTDASESPRPRMRFEMPLRSYSTTPPKAKGTLAFAYGGCPVSPAESGEYLYDMARRVRYRRDLPAEHKAEARLEALGVRKKPPAWWGAPPEWQLNVKKLPGVARELIREGWHVEAEGLAYRSAVSVRAEVSTGIDWFELSGGVDFGQGEVPFPDLLKALERGEDWVTLPDGSFGLLPGELEEKYGLLMRLGNADGSGVRYKASQGALLDALLAARGEISTDERFAEVRARLAQFRGVAAVEQPEGFQGRLRGYQQEGLGWMLALRTVGLGGCLADDMGVGKTPQVLALLETRRGSGTSLVVAPRSLIHNWALEAARFTPALRLLDLSGPGRTLDPAVWREHDLLLATYGTLRRDAAAMQGFLFDTLVLDESQAIKNAETASAKSARLVQAHQRLALTGTPIENHLGELWSLFDFLNPGMLGAWWKKSAGAASLRNPDPETRRLLAQAVRPYMLRRTKEQVASELPKKTEQTIFCELEDEQKQLYSELRDHYRAALLGLVEEKGIARSKIQILEALLRLRQAACHPALIDKKRVGQASAKLESLLANLAEVMEEGHKALVFSQFTQFLGLLRTELDSQGIVYEYLDGKTRDRQARVERFQTDGTCKLFLISLKAGGFGLNLTAADYVFLLDPWWNPAVEAQAVDRTHRIGQVNPVFAYRLIARGTVEERVLELQEKKRQLADAILSQDSRVLTNLKREDLELLLS